MASKPSPEFRAEVVREAMTTGPLCKQVAANFGIAFSTPGRWIRQDRRSQEKPAVQSYLEREVAELRKENRMPPGGEGCSVYPIRAAARLCAAKTVRPMLHSKLRCNLPPELA